ncbi:hypothetical protein N7468_004272 [Penicillium chermesinum]|uniref:Uncharacterized protein n=1 Tax=Penicillium chermesinum TaxID=63820 RepID=A0A9W9PAK8_9EURO|nr:uncharacterized protein N7468_004272 [Penicillium chermesinum]KAJ5239653.1 hypothetical protein N7468_004272 [Penicillium chermesinum]KAJ6166541.1 hypothetical protein N7470_001988 [Penicillium chermesinum]
MSTLTRAFTKRSKRPEVSAPMPFRGDEKIKSHTRFNSGSIKRGNISGPVQLISSTNALVYDAPDLDLGSPNSSSASSLRSRGDSDVAISPQSYASSITTPDSSPHDAFPVDAHYFPKHVPMMTSPPRSSTNSASSNEIPIVPKRALSHTKRSHQDLAQRRSQSRMSPPPLHSPRSVPAIRSSQEIFQPEAHPFSKELAQVNEVAEEFGIAHVPHRVPTIVDEEEMQLLSKGLKKFTVDDYLCEIEELYGNIFEDKIGSISAGPWL